MKRLVLLFAVLPLMAAASERWLEVAPRDASHGGMALNLSSVRPSQTKGLDDATAMEVMDAKSVWLTHYEVRCGRGLIHQVERRGLDPKSSKLGPSAPVVGDWAKPQGDGEARILDIVCRPDSVGGDVISDRRAMIWLLAK
ncbi:MAG TPA: hypothetical protein VG407_17765 [Caulobacteraceae bacterium]|jgi:hypothetical protein|nr:hypothetical protein [Caulobacteraceae bacterium]